MIDFVKTPWAHQKRGVEKAIGLPCFFFIWDPGTGKSAALITTLRNKYAAAGRILRTIIFTPPVVVQKWKDKEWKEHSRVGDDAVVCLTGSQKKRVADFLKHSKENKIFITNYEALLMEDLYKLFQEYQFEAFGFDESHKLKDPKTKKAKLAFALAHPPDKASPLVYNLTGTAVLNTPLDLFQQCKVLDGGRLFGGNYFGFRARYFVDKNAGMPRDKYFPKWEIRPGALDEINERLSRVATRERKEDCMDLPPLVREILKVGMLPDQKKVYDQMRRDFVAFIGDAAASANLAIVKALRLMQIASGYIPLDSLGDDERSQKTWEKTPKLEALEELLEEFIPNDKVVVWATWRENYKQLEEVCRKIGTTPVFLTGGMTAHERDKSIRSFEQDRDCRVLLGHPGAGGIGVDLLAAGYSIFYSRTFSLEHSLQAEARNHRGGSLEAGHKKITRIDLVCEGTIDEEVVKRLHQKETISESILTEALCNG